MTGSTQGGAGPQPTQRPAPRSGGGVAFGSFTITDASSGASKEIATRQRRYAITMAFRTACFLAMIFVPGALRWVLFACAVFLPYVAVLLANQARRPDKGTHAGSGEPSDATAVTTGERPQLLSGEVIRGDVEEDRDDRVA